MQPNDSLCQSAIDAARRDPAPVYLAETVSSTNDWAKELARSGAPSGAAVIADRQTGGRGRNGRSFHSPPGQGIYLSVLYRPLSPMRQWMHLTCCTAVALCLAIEEVSGIHPGIKWPNDVVFGGRKLSGILTEAVLQPGGTADSVVIGLGLNCGQGPEDFPPALREIAISIRMAAGRAPDRSRMAAAILNHLDQMARTLLSRSPDWMADYRSRCVTLGRTVQVIGPELTRQGRAVDVGPQGELLVDFGSGPEAVRTGEVSVRGLESYL